MKTVGFLNVRTVEVACILLSLLSSFYLHRLALTHLTVNNLPLLMKLEYESMRSGTPILHFILTQLTTVNIATPYC
jgi:hypothetical protein